MFALDTSNHGNNVLYKETRSWVPVAALETYLSAKESTQQSISDEISGIS